MSRVRVHARNNRPRARSQPSCAESAARGGAQAPGPPPGPHIRAVAVPHRKPSSVLGRGDAPARPPVTSLRGWTVTALGEEADAPPAVLTGGSVRGRPRIGTGVRLRIRHCLGTTDRRAIAVRESDGRRAAAPVCAVQVPSARTSIPPPVFDRHRHGSVLRRCLVPTADRVRPEISDRLEEAESAAEHHDARSRDDRRQRRPLHRRHARGRRQARRPIDHARVESRTQVRDVETSTVPGVRRW